jgi:GntR family transcriptional repressor for pyruvate dehydrogenase complex
LRDGDQNGMFRPVNSGRLSTDIVEQVVSAIRDGSLRTGDRLPSEREMVEQFGVSRLSVRDAIRVLETKGLVEVKRGTLGGAFVADGTAGVVMEGLATMVALSPSTAEDVTEARMVLELNALPLAIERATEEDLAELEAICDERDAALADGTYSTELSVMFHRRLARAAHNVAIELLVESFYGSIVESLVLAAHVAPPAFQIGSNDHRDILAALRKRDLETAQRVLASHLGGTRERLKSARSSSATTEHDES